MMLSFPQFANRISQESMFFSRVMKCQKEVPIDGDVKYRLH